MKCRSCGRPFDAAKARCPSCGAPNPAVSGVFQTSTVRISTGRADRVYHSLDEVPATLRNRLQRSTNSANSATILIADRRGRREIARSLKGWPTAGSRRVAQSIAGVLAPSGPAWLTPRRRNAILLLFLALLAVVAFFAFRLLA